MMISGRPSPAALAAVVLPFLGALAACSGGGEGGGDGEETPASAPRVVGQRTGAEPFSPAGVNATTAAYDPAKDLVVALWKTRVTIPAGTLAEAATIEMTLVPGGLTTTPKHRPQSPFVTFRALGADGRPLPRGGVKKAFAVETLVDRISVERDLHVLLHTEPGTAAESRQAIANKSLAFVANADGSRIVAFSLRDTDFGHAVMSAEGGVFPAGYTEFPGLPPESLGLTAETLGPSDEPSEAWLRWTPGEGSRAGYMIAVAYDGAAAAPYCEGGRTLDPAAIVSERTSFPTKIFVDETQLGGLESGKVASIRLCSVNGRVPPDVSEGITTTFDLPDRAAATLAGAPTARSNATTLDVSVGGDGVAEYKYAYRVDTATCDGATYSDWIPVATKITDAVAGEGEKVLCVLGKKSEVNVQLEPTRHSWVMDVTAPGAFTIGTVASPTNDTAPALTWSAATDAATYDVTLATDSGCTTAAQTIPSVTGTTATAQTLAEGFYFVCVAALDEAGNRRAASNDGVPLEIDVTAPVFTSVALAFDAADGYVNLAEKSNTTALANTLVASGHATAGYALAPQATACDGALTYGTVPKSDSAAWGDDGAYKVCVRLGDDAGNATFGASSAIVLDDTVPVFTSVALAGDATDLYLNLAERSNATDLVGAAVASGHDAVHYKVVTNATACSGVGAYDTSIPTSDVAGAFGADGSYKVCVKVFDLAGNPTVYGASGAFTLDTDPPAVTSVSATDGNDAYAAGEVLHLTASLDEAVALGGSAGAITLKLETGTTDQSAIYTGGAGTTTLAFEYTIQAGDESVDLNFHATAPQLVLGGDRTLRDAAGNPLGTDLSSATSLSANKNLVVDTTPPSAFNIMAPTAASTVRDNTPTITWSNPGDAASYDVKIDGDSGCPSPEQSYAAVAGLSQTATTLADGTWYICILARDAAGNTAAVANDNLSFTVATGTWAATTATGSPGERKGHSAVWDTVNARMIVWGGEHGDSYLDTGASYDPMGNAWSATDTADAELPEERSGHTATWTGTKMVVWGGRNGGATQLATGGVFDPAGPDYWTATSPTGAPSARRGHSAVWSGTRVLIFGGHDGTSVVDTGGSYDPTGDAWTALDAADADRPAAREGHTAVWTGSYMIVWGGANGGGTALATGARFDPTGGGAADYWLTMSGTSAPAARLGHTAVWTGSKMVVWGGWDGTAYRNDGAMYDPATDTWTALATTEAPAGRRDHAAVWDTGNARMIVFGGFDGTARLASGGAFAPGTNAWVVPALNASGAAAARDGARAVWSGTRMVVFGGDDGTSALNSGARFTP